MRVDGVVATPVPIGRVYYGWVVLAVAAAAMVGTLPGRTQGLGLVTELLIADLRIGRVDYAQLNLVATLIGSLFALGVGRLIDRLGSRIVLTVVVLGLGLVVGAMSQAEALWPLAIAITLTRGLGQSALSVVSLTMVGQWFVRRIDLAMAIYSFVLSVGFMAAFPIVGALVQSWGWREAWLGVGVALVAALAPLGWILVRPNPEACGLEPDGDAARQSPRRGRSSEGRGGSSAFADASAFANASADRRSFSGGWSARQAGNADGIRR